MTHATGAEAQTQIETESTATIKAPHGRNQTKQA
jgi:hypothetical protein